MILSFDVSNDFLDMLFEVSHTVLTTNGEGEHGAATARRKLEPDGGSPNKYEHGKRKPLGAGSTRRQEMG